MDDDKIKLIREWTAQLNEAAAAYYNGLGEKMTDFEWDALFDRLKALEAETGFSLPDSPTRNVSADDVSGQKEPHEFPALSLAKTKQVRDVAKWAEGRPIWLSWKLDGLTLVVTYDGGRLSKVVTRGDGHVGTNITHLAAGIRGIPQTIGDKGHLVVRGEAVISYSDFDAFLSLSQEEYANPRNLAAGSLSLKDGPGAKAVDELRRRNIQWIPFSLVHVEPDIMSWGERMAHLEAVGLGAVERERIDSPDEASIKAAIDRWTIKVTDKAQPFPVDGLVVVYDDVAYARTGSVTGHHATRAGFAFKWQDETASTVLDHVEWSCAVGSICPVAVFAPVALEGTTVKRASLCNISECERLGIGGRGTEMEVIKANKIIPKVVAVTRREGEFAVPEVCPVCGAPTEVRTSETGTKTLRCTNAECPARQLAKYERFVSKAGMDIDGLAGETLAKFVNKGWIRTVADIYRLGEHHAEIAALDGFGERSADNIRAAVESARSRAAVNFLVALSIPLCGQDVAKRLLGAYPLKDLLAAARSASDAETFSAIDGIGPVKSKAFVEWCRDPVNQALLDDLLAQVTLKEFSASEGGKCSGLTFVVTGDVHHYANRDALKVYIESQGGKVAGSVSAKTSFLINNDASSTSGKSKKAQALGVPVITEDEFIGRFGG